MSDVTRSPGSNPHADRPNWRPAETIDDYLANCREGLEDYSDERAAKLLGWPRVRVWRAKLMAEIPEELVDRLMKAGHMSSKALSNVALALRGESQNADFETCPHCGEVLRIRSRVRRDLADIVNTWLEEQARAASEASEAA